MLRNRVCARVLETMITLLPISQMHPHDIQGTQRRDVILLAGVELTSYTIFQKKTACTATDLHAAKWVFQNRSG